MADVQKTSRHLIAGFTGGLVSAVTLQPLDLLKTRVQQSGSNSIIGVFRELSSFKQLWRGTLPSALRTSIGSALYLSSLNFIRSHISTVRISASSAASKLSINKNISSALPKLSNIENLATGMFARGLVGFITMPITILKIRFESDIYQYKSISQGFKSIFKEEGINGFFRGFWATCARDAPYAGLYVLFYEQLKSILPTVMYKININDTTTTANNNKDNNIPRSAIINSLSAATAAAIATTITAPFDTIKTCMQLNSTKYKSLTSTTRTLISNEGLLRLFDGLSLRLIRKACSAGIAWCIYEELIKL
ncbi:hypothetical protein BVG19_g4622 [[Candida] boidinii]|nr:hypothetical protein BVG19_g4622 [[Candida] boidinii]OWB48969.1 hypothetical protein B5S27_g508 [[Candida] boidinii]OWB65867.1 hypothetical protein B5S30_g1200 [[Candida] boidinii]